MSAEKNWPQATKNSVEKVAKRVTELEKKAHVLALNVTDVDNRLDTMQAAASASALVQAVKDVAAAIREGGVLTSDEFNQLMTALSDLSEAATLK